MPLVTGLNFWSAEERSGSWTRWLLLWFNPAAEHQTAARRQRRSCSHWLIPPPCPVGWGKEWGKKQNSWVEIRTV